MENRDDTIIVAKGTHPLLIVTLFGAIVTGVVMSGSHFSKLHTAARDLEEDFRGPSAVLSVFAR